MTPHTAESFLTALYAEAARSRRFGHALSIAFIAPAPPTLRRPLRMMLRPGDRQPARALATAVRAHLRGFDVLGIDRRQVAVIAPETDQQGMAVLAARLEAVATEGRIRVRTGIASLTEDGPAIPDMISAAAQRRDGPRSPVTVGATPSAPIRPRQGTTLRRRDGKVDAA